MCQDAVSRIKTNLYYQLQRRPLRRPPGEYVRVTRLRAQSSNSPCNYMRAHVLRFKTFQVVRIVPSAIRDTPRTHSRFVGFFFLKKKPWRFRHDLFTIQDHSKHNSCVSCNIIIFQVPVFHVRII